MTTPDEAQALLPVTPEGPRITVKASCFDCPFVVSESYRVQSDSGSNVYCAHPSFEKRQRVGDTVWDTPDFCPVADIPAIRARVQSHSLPEDVGMREALDSEREWSARLMRGIEKLAAIIGGETPDDLHPSEADDRRYREATPILAELGMTIEGGADKYDPIGWGFDWSNEHDEALKRAALTPSPCPGDVGNRKFTLGDRVSKKSGANWNGHVVGFYSTALTPIGYAVESEREIGSVQIYPEAALTPSALSGDAGDGLDRVTSSISFGNLRDLVGMQRELRPGTFAYAALIDLLAALPSHQGTGEP